MGSLFNWIKCPCKSRRELKKTIEVQNQEIKILDRLVARKKKKIDDLLDIVSELKKYEKVVKDNKQFLLTNQIIKE